MKKVIISCGTIPARVDSVKFLGNRFKGGLAFKTANFLADCGFDVTVIKWKFTEFKTDRNIKVVDILDVFEYYDFFEKNALMYDAFVLAGAVANLTPSNPLEGKFPSHNYKVGEKFNIEFEIAPRTIDLIKKINPRACLIGYKLFDASTDEELIEIGRHTLHESKANIIFANYPSKAKYEKIALFQDNTAMKINFDEHLELIARMINANYYKTEVRDLSREYNESALIEHFERTIDGFGCIAFRLEDGGFITTSRGHKSGFSVVKEVDIINNKVIVEGSKATLNAPTLDAIFKQVDCDYIVHRHEFIKDAKTISFLIAGSEEEACGVSKFLSRNPECREFNLEGHGYIKCLNFEDVDWSTYYEEFPSKYFSTPQGISDIMASESFRNGKTLEVGGNTNVEAKYAYDPYILAENAINLTKEDIEQMTESNFDYIILRNSISYLSRNEIKQLIKLLKKGGKLIANTFLNPPSKKVSKNEVAYLGYNSLLIHHHLMNGDKITKHTFYGRPKNHWENLFQELLKYGSNSVILIHTKK